MHKNIPFLSISVSSGMDLAPGFEFSEAHNDKISSLFSVWNDAFVDYELWKIIFKESDPKEIHPYFVKTCASRWTIDDVAMWRIRETSSG
jgi:hypothetical protein